MQQSHPLASFQLSFFTVSKVEKRAASVVSAILQSSSCLGSPMRLKLLAAVSTCRLPFLREIVRCEGSRASKSKAASLLIETAYS